MDRTGTCSFVMARMKERACDLFAAAGRAGAFVAMFAGSGETRGIENVYLTGVPDYAWHAGCFGTASGNLIGYWDRHGFPDFYTGPTNGGLAPMDSFGSRRGIQSLWASEAGLDGRPSSLPGHIDDYYAYYEFTGSDPFERSARGEHSPDCTGDFIGLNQRKWPDLAGECTGNIDGYSFNYFDRGGERRTNFTPTDGTGAVVPDIQSGLREFARFRGYRADTYSQLADFNPDKPGGIGFTFGDLKAEIDAGYPVLLFMQAFGEFARDLSGSARVNPTIHGMLAYGYVIEDDGTPYVRYRTSWASGDNQFSAWTDADWTPDQSLNLPLRGVIGFRPRPRIVSVARVSRGLEIRWHGPQSILRDESTEQETPVNRFVVEEAADVVSGSWKTVSEPVAGLSVTLPGCCEGEARFFRVRSIEGNAVDGLRADRSFPSASGRTRAPRRDLR